MKYLAITLFEYWNFEDIKGFEMGTIALSDFESSMLKIEFYNYEESWKMLSFDLTYYRGFATLINVAVDKLINYFFWKTLQF